MATRRNVVEKTAQEKEFEPVAGEKSNIAPAVPAHVIYKLLGFTFAMVIGPIGWYFLSLNTLFGGNSTYAGGSAAIVANVVLVGYIIVAFQDDQSEALEAAEKEKRESKKGI